MPRNDFNVKEVEARVVLINYEQYLKCRCGGNSLKMSETGSLSVNTVEALVNDGNVGIIGEDHVENLKSPNHTGSNCPRR